MVNIWIRLTLFIQTSLHPFTLSLGSLAFTVSPFLSLFSPFFFQSPHLIFLLLCVPLTPSLAACLIRRDWWRRRPLRPPHFTEPQSINAGNTLTHTRTHTHHFILWDFIGYPLPYSLFFAVYIILTFSPWILLLFLLLTFSFLCEHVIAFVFEHFLVLFVLTSLFSFYLLNSLFSALLMFSFSFPRLMCSVSSLALPKVKTDKVTWQHSLPGAEMKLLFILYLCFEQRRYSNENCLLAIIRPRLIKIILFQKNMCYLLVICILDLMLILSPIFVICHCPPEWPISYLVPPYISEILQVMQVHLVSWIMARAAPTGRLIH